MLCVHPGAELFGSDRMFLESVIGLVEDGARVVVALPEDGPLAPRLRAAGAEVLTVRMLVLRKALLAPRAWAKLIWLAASGMYRAWRTVRRIRPDAVYTGTVTIPHWPLAARLAGARSVSHIHEAEASGSRLVNRMLYLPHLLSQTVIANSEFSRRTIEACLPRLGRRTGVVYNGVEGAPSPALPRAEISGALRVTYVGRLSPRKGPDVAMRAAGLLASRGISTHVDLLGAVFAGYEWFEEELRTLARELGPETTVTFHGFHDDIWPIVAESDILVVPSRVDEPFGNTAVEGILALRPVIASDTSGLREAAGGYPTTMLVTPDSAEALATALETVRSDWARVRSGLSDAASRARERHSPATYRRAIAALVAGRARDTRQ